MNLRYFKEYLAEGISRKVTTNIQRAKSLIEDSNKRHIFLTQIIKSVSITDDNANYFIEEVYDILISLIRAKMFIEGYEASGNYSHQAEVSYLRELTFSEAEINIMDEIRQFRNGIKYYGRRYTKNEADNCLNFLNSMLPKLKKLVENVK